MYVCRFLLRSYVYMKARCANIFAKLWLGQQHINASVAHPCCAWSFVDIFINRSAWHSQNECKIAKRPVLSVSTTGMQANISCNNCIYMSSYVKYVLLLLPLVKENICGRRTDVICAYRLNNSIVVSIPRQSSWIETVPVKSRTWDIDNAKSPRTCK